MLTYVQRNKDYARQLRGRLTDAEQRLWFHLRRDQLGVRFYRQKPLGPYIVDFHAPRASLVVELDGSQHADDPTQKVKDVLRDAWLVSQGLTVLRFDDRQVLTETRVVLEVILQVVNRTTGAEIPDRTTSQPTKPPNNGGQVSGCPSPPFSKGGEIPLQAERSAPPFEKGGAGGISQVAELAQTVKKT